MTDPTDPRAYTAQMRVLMNRLADHMAYHDRTGVADHLDDAVAEACALEELAGKLHAQVDRLARLAWQHEDEDNRGAGT